MSWCLFLCVWIDLFTLHIHFPTNSKPVKTTIITLWMAAIVISISLHINEPLDYIPSVGICKPAQANIPGTLIMLLCFIIPIVLITITSIYLSQRIIKSKKIFHSVKRNAAQERKSIKAGRLLEILQEQVKSTQLSSG